MRYSGYRSASSNRLHIEGIGRTPVDKSQDPEFWRKDVERSQQLRAEQDSREPINWPVNRQLALMVVRRGAFADDVGKHLRDKGASASQHDFLFLRNEGLAVRPLAERYHRITPYGTRQADKLAWLLGKELGLHHVTYEFDSYNEHKARCCCGWFASGDRKLNASWMTPLKAAADAHLADPKDWIRKQEASRKMMAGILNVVGRANDG